MKRARIDGADLEYDVSGEGEPVVFIHGAFIADAFRPLLAELSRARQYQLILYWRRGYAGSSDATASSGVDRHAADCRALLCHLRVERAHVVGHSYGGAVALELALDTPSAVHSLALLEPALLLGSSEQGYRESLARSMARYRDVGAPVAVHEFLQARCPGYREELDRVMPGAFAQAVADAGMVFEHELPSLLDWRFSEARARRIGQPVLSVLGGESDALSPRFNEVHESLLAWLPRAEGFVLPGATHFHQLDNPRGLAEALSSFWRRHRLSVGTL
jgi:pimeloyl-ACP methyl ester carboxylesterase